MPKWGLTLAPDDRIQQLGVGTVMGLPGDTNLELLHYIGSTDMHWGKISSLPMVPHSANRTRTSKSETRMS